MLKNFTWNMTGYIPKYPVDLSADGIRPYIAERIFQLEPEPPKVSSSNEYILSALQEKNLLYFHSSSTTMSPSSTSESNPFWALKMARDIIQIVFWT